MTAVAAVVLLSGYVFFSFSGIGQSVDDQAKIARDVDDQTVASAVGYSLRLINSGTFVAMIVVLVAVGWARHRRAVAAAAAIAFAAGVVTAEAMKAVLPRPELASEYASLVYGGRDFDTYPSGHSTVATGFVLGLVLVSSQRWRLRVGVVGALWAIWVTGGVVVVGWHRPSDAIGGIALASLFSSIAAWLVIKRQGESIPRDRPCRTCAWFAGAALLSTGTFLLSVLLARSQGVTEDVVWWLFPVSVLIIIWFAAAMIGWFTTILLGVRFRRA